MANVLITLKKILNHRQKELARVKKYEKDVRELWTREYARFLKATKTYRSLKRLNTKRAKRLGEIIDGWDKRTVELTKKRDDMREAIAELEKEIIELRLAQTGLLNRFKAEQEAGDEIVNQVFSLTDTVLAALEKRNDYLLGHVFPRLTDREGKMRSQVTIANSENTRKVVVLSNYLQLVEPQMAAEAIALIEKFFNRIQPKVEVDGDTLILYEITKQLLVIKVTPKTFRIGPELSHFLGIKIAKTKFPELWQAQDLLARSLRSEKTSKYIRLFERNTPDEKWQQVKQTV